MWAILPQVERQMLPQELVTRVYHRKRKSTKVKIGYTKRDGLAAVQTEVLINESPCWAAKATVTVVNHRANLRVGKVRDVYTHFVGAFF